MNFDLNRCEFPKIVEKMIPLSQTFYGKEALKQLYPSSNMEEILTALQETEEMRKCIISYGDLPFGGIKDIRNSLKRAEVESVVSAHSLFEISETIYGCLSLLRYAKTNLNHPNSFLTIQEKIQALHPCDELYKKITESIDSDGSIFDHATPELYKIRHEIRNKESGLRSKMNECVRTHSSELADTLIVLRDGRYCLCVKSEFKNTFKGVIHDESSSGSTIYIEPSISVEMSNQIFSLKNEEKREMEKILRILTLSVKDHKEELEENLEILTHLDFTSAKAKYAILTDSYLPNINHDGIIQLNQARHPLIDPNIVVPIDISMDSEISCIVITGPNTGGKTVTLKTVGLLSMMVSSGCLVPCLPTSNLAVFDSIVSDIGDEQSIEQSLSTFSGHMKHIIEIIQSLETNSLILLDELGSGTDPKEGSTLAMAIIDFLAKRNTRVIVTSHYGDLKEFAFQKPYCMNASVEFDTNTLKPTYRLLQGVPGKSNAIEISSHLGLDTRIIEDAKEKMTHYDTDTSMVIEKLERQITSMNQKEEEYQKEIEKAKALEQLYQEKIKSLDLQSIEIKKKAELEANQYISDLKERGEEILASLKKASTNPDLAKAKYELKNIKKDVPTVSIQENHDFQPSDLVYVIPYEAKGIIIKEKKKDVFTVKMGVITLDFNKSDLRYEGKYVPPKEPNKIILDTSKIVKQGKMELDLRGYRYQEVALEVDKFIDNAYLCHIKSIRIIHGFGTGAVRKAVHQQLDKNPYVVEYRYGQEGEGLNGVTIVTLK